ncbi:ATP-binding cassette domain-containing protein [Rudaeicoccus suwonensis]|nr:ATP-binding cassette domain-containing protein [Rudaeicoccus suwonensis]
MTDNPRPLQSLGDKAVEVRQLTCRFGDFVAVDGIDLDVPAGSVLGLLGPNGAGKTTTVRVLATLLKPSGGTARVFGHDVVQQSHRVRSLIGLTGQYASVDEELTARENLMIFGRLQGHSRAAARRRGVELLDEFALGEAADRPVRAFSGGMRRRLDLAASLIAEPPLIFLDEPTTGLDPRTRQQMWDTARRLVAAGSTLVLTTQYLEEADQLADNIVVIDRGRIVAQGTADELKSSLAPATLRVVPTDHDDMPVVRQVLHQLTGHEPQTQDNREVAVPVEDTALVTEALILLQDRGVHIEEVGVHKPTLDEVFLSLTGGSSSDTDDSGAAVIEQEVGA